VPDATEVPLEIKSGRWRNSVKDRAQVILYTLLLADQNGSLDDDNHEWGLLAYAQTDERAEVAMLAVEPTLAEVTSIMCRRNELAANLSTAIQPSKTAEEAASYPPVLDDVRNCEKCRALRTCAVMLRSEIDAAATGGSGEGERLPEVFRNNLGHLTRNHTAFLRHWDRLLLLENEANACRRALPSLPIQTIRARGGGSPVLCGLIIDDESSSPSSSTSVLRLVRNRTKVEEHLAPLAGQHMLLSSEAAGFEGAGATHILARGEITVGWDGNAMEVRLFQPLRKGGLLRVDVDDNSQRLTAQLRGAVVGLLTWHHKLRRLVIDLHEPTFGKPTSPLPNFNTIAPPLNHRQVNAAVRAVCANDYALVISPPGAGKTATLVATLQALLCNRSLSVLVCAHTHSAVDAILMKVLALGMDFVRVGNSADTPKEVMRKFLGTFETVRELKKFANTESARLIACTCIGTSNPFFKHKRFDVCIVDEASQISLPEALLPLQLADRFILFGNPAVRSQPADGMESLLCRLAATHPSAVTWL